MHRSITTVLFLVLFCPLLTTAVKPGRMEISGQEQLARGTFNNLRIAADGSMKLDRELREVAELEEESLYSLAVVDGALYAGTGTEGRIYRIGQDGRVELVFDSPEHSVLCLATGRKGVLYAGTGPDGIIYEIHPNREARILAQTGTQYVWALAVMDGGALLATTGSPGKLFRVEEKNVEEIFSCQQEHLLALTRRGDEWLIAGSGDGIVYAYNGKMVRPFFQADRNEIGDLVPGQTTYIMAINAVEAQDAPRQQPDLIYALHEDGFIEVLHSSNQSLYSMNAFHDELLVSSGDMGELCYIGKDGAVALTATRLGGPIAQLLPDNKNLWLAMFSPPKILHVSDTPADRGEYESEPQDAGTSARWGRLHAVTMPTGSTLLRFWCRSGSTKHPDEFWSNWVEVDQADGRILCPPARFLQWRAEFRRGNEPVVLHSLEITYQKTNHSPRITELTIYPLRHGMFQNVPPSPKKIFQQRLPGGLTLEYNFQNDEPGGLSKGRWIRLRELRTVSWTATDPDSDALLAGLSFRKVGSNTWIKLVEEWPEQFYTVDTSSLEDGRYQIKVVVDDSQDNTIQDSLTREFVAPRYMVVDRTPPVIEHFEVIQKQGTLRLEARVSDAMSAMDSAEIMLDGAHWRQIAPEDGILDDRRESFLLTIEAGEPSAGVYLRITDEAQNITAASWP
ncbi:hypothetical protein JW905_11545 [bacterium]|nr:hypothetical protein [candidate division CSSED10-310 bacterium]